MKLLEHLHIVALLENETGKNYFMPCALARAKAIAGSSEGQSAEQYPSLLVCFTHGYCPVGLFAALVVHLLGKQKEKDGFQWRLKEDKIFKNQISFSVGPSYTVTITVWPDFLMVTCKPPACEVECTKLAEICLEVRESIKTGIHKVTSNLQYRDASHYLAFKCTNNHQGPNQAEFHPAKILDCHGKTLSLETCNGNNPYILECNLPEEKPPTSRIENLPLPDGYKMWFPEVHNNLLSLCIRHTELLCSVWW